MEFKKAPEPGWQDQVPFLIVFQNKADIYFKRVLI